MKNAMKRAGELRSLFKRLLKEYKPEPMETLEPLDALVQGAMSYDVSDRRAAEAIRHIHREFVDLNELRVATDLEIQELLGVKYPAIEQRVALITQSLNAIFEREQTMSLDRLKGTSKREARQFLKDLPEMNPFVEAYVMLFSFDGNAVPIDGEIAGYLKNQGIVEESASVEEVQRFVEHHIRVEESYEFFMVIRKAAHGDLPAGVSRTRKKAGTRRGTTKSRSARARAKSGA